MFFTRFNHISDRYFSYAANMFLVHVTDALVALETNCSEVFQHNRVDTFLLLDQLEN